MDGRRWKQWALAGAMAAAVGCKSGPTATSGMPAPPQLGGGSGFSLFRPKPPGPVPPPAEQPISAVELARKKGPLRPETIAAFADAQVDAAFANDEASSADTGRALDEARLKYQKALERDPKNYDAMRGLARLYTRIGDRDQALATYAALVRQYPQDHKAAYEQSLAHARFEDWDGATAACRRALTLDPQSLRYTRTLGVCLARTGRPQEGFDLLAKVMPEAEARTAMAKVFADGGQADLARQQLELAVKADPAFAAAKNLLAQFTEQQPQPPAAPPAGGNPVQPVAGLEPRGN
jgi:tetratricopeptide (TPR) repeat protein